MADDVVLLEKIDVEDGTGFAEIVINRPERRNALIPEAAEGVISAARTLGLDKPLVVRLEGTNVDEGKRIMVDSGLAIIPADNLADAAEKIVAAVKEAS